MISSAVTLLTSPKISAVTYLHNTKKFSIHVTLTSKHYSLSPMTAGIPSYVPPKIIFGSYLYLIEYLHNIKLTSKSILPYP